jgi:LmbE family N-acetylglucosaminyl deacetylase
MSAPDPTARANPVNEVARHGEVSTDLPTPGVVLAIGAHPDDIEFGCGATLAKWAGGGAAIHHLVLTDGSKGSWDPDQDTGALIALRQDEQRRAAAILGGGDVQFLGWVDGELHNGTQAQREVCRTIRTVRPDVVLSHDPWRRYRLHPDHRHAGFIVTDAVVAARDPHFFPEQGLTPHRPRALLLWEADEPNHVEAVGAYVDTKLRALMAHESQHRSTMGIEPDVGDDTAAPPDFAHAQREQLRRHGALAGVDQGESFHLITDT